MREDIEVWVREDIEVWVRERPRKREEDKEGARDGETLRDRGQKRRGERDGRTCKNGSVLVHLIRIKCDGYPR